MTIKIIVEIPFLAKGIIFSVQSILEVLLVFLGSSKGRVDNSTYKYSYFLFPFYMFLFIIPVFQLPPTSMTVSQSLCHLLTPHMII